MTDRNLLAVIVFAALASLASPTAAAPSEGCGVLARERAVGAFTHETWPIVQFRPDGSEVLRTYTVHVPPQHQEDQLTPLPIVLDLHVALSSGFQQDIESRMSTKGKEDGFIVVQPDSWPWWATSLVEEALRGGVSDVEYIARLLDTLDDKLCVDRDRIFVVSGRYTGWMASALACASAKGELGRHQIAAVATVSSFPIPAIKGAPWALDAPSDFLKVLEICPELKRNPTPLLVIFSDNDLTLGPLVPAATGSTAIPESDQLTSALDGARTAYSRLIISEDPLRGTYQVLDDTALSASESVLKVACAMSTLWAKENGCKSGELLPFLKCRRLDSPKASSTAEEWGIEKDRIDAGCTSVPQRRAAVRFISVQTGSYDRNGHVWPGGLAGGRLSATTEVWDFFKNHSR